LRAQVLFLKLVPVRVHSGSLQGLFDGKLACFGCGEEMRGRQAFLMGDGGPSETTDKDGLLLGLLAAEITAVTGKDPGLHITRGCGAKSGSPSY
jgi:phosphoglucomutase